MTTMATITSYPLAVTAPKTDATDFSDFLGPNSRMPTDITFNVVARGSAGEVVKERVSAHKAILAKTVPAFDKLFFEKDPGSPEKSPLTFLEIDMASGLDGVEAFQLFVFHCYGRKVKMEELDKLPVLVGLARLGMQYDIQQLREDADVRMNELVEVETNFDALSKLSALAGQLDLKPLQLAVSLKIEGKVMAELTSSVKSKLRQLESVESKEKIMLLKDLSELAIKHELSSLKPAVFAHLEAVVVTDENFSSLLAFADGSCFMKPLRKVLAR